MISVTMLRQPSLPIRQTIRLGPHPCRIAGALGASSPSVPFRNCSEAFDTAWPSQGLVQAKVPNAVLPESPSEAGPKGPSTELIRAVVAMKLRNPNWGCPRIAQQMALAF